MQLLSYSYFSSLIALAYANNIHCFQKDSQYLVLIKCLKRELYKKSFSIFVDQSCVFALGYIQVVS